MIPSPKDKQDPVEGASIGISSAEDTKVTMRHKKYDSEDYTKDERSGNSSGDSDLTTEQVEDEHSYENLAEAANYKRLYFITISIFISLLITYKLEISFSDRFTGSLIGYLFMFMIFDVILYQIFTRFILNEALLVSPFLASLSSNTIIMNMAAADFTSYMECYAFTVGMLVFQRLYLNPFIEWFEEKIQSFTIFLMTKFKFAEKLFKSIIIKQLKLESKLLANMNRNSQISGTNTEGLLGTMVKYSAQIQAIFMAPFLLLVIVNFPDATQIPKNYSIPTSDVRYYFMFASVIIIPHLMIDLLLFHLLEVIYDYKIFDYLTYSWYRFKNRKDW